MTTDNPCNKDLPAAMTGYSLHSEQHFRHLVSSRTEILRTWNATKPVAMNTRSAVYLTGVLLFHLPALVFAQANSWTNATSGNWEDPYWSLGALPGTNQDIMLTNAGWKALAIDPNTSQNFPQTMTVNSITISSPSNSYNTLLLNYSGAVTPLTVESLTVESNSAMTMLSSALELDGPNGVGMQIGGVFNQNDSLVTGNQINVGYIGPGIYNMSSGILDVSNLWVGGGFDGVFNQTGGTNDTGIVGIDPGGTYNLSGGDFNATVYANGNSAFHQTGGSINQPLTIFQGTYLFDGGFDYAGVVAPIGNGEGFPFPHALVIQTGGTNFGALNVGSNGVGNYVLSNGCSYLESLNIGPEGFFQQFGGTLIITNTLSSWGDYINNDPTWSAGTYQLNGGLLKAGAMALANGYNQYGGTNIITGDITVGSFFYGDELWLQNGLLAANNLTAQVDGVRQIGGIMIITNQLTIDGDGTMAYFGPDLDVTGGELIVSNIDVERGNFAISGTILKQTGTLTLGQTSSLLPGSGTYTFGPLSPDGSVALGTNMDCQIHFADSSSQPWSVLIVKNWSGSIYGGGAQQIIFGSNSAALTSNELSHIEFWSPAGLPPSSLPAGIYLARILSTGEIVPDTGAPLPLKMVVGGALSNGAMPLSIQGDIGQKYEIDVSTDLVNWIVWTDQSNSTGTISITDSDATNFPQRFYRARVLP